MVHVFTRVSIIDGKFGSSRIRLPIAQHNPGSTRKATLRGASHGKIRKEVEANTSSSIGRRFLAEKRERKQMQLVRMYEIHEDIK
jgi:hypothetical protein